MLEPKWPGALEKALCRSEGVGGTDVQENSPSHEQSLRPHRPPDLEGHIMLPLSDRHFRSQPCLHRSSNPRNKGEDPAQRGPPPEAPSKPSGNIEAMPGVWQPPSAHEVSTRGPEPTDTACDAHALSNREEAGSPTSCPSTTRSRRRQVGLARRRREGLQGAGREVSCSKKVHSLSSKEGIYPERPSRCLPPGSRRMRKLQGRQEGRL